jgi:hypothetical protein
VVKLYQILKKVCIRRKGCCAGVVTGPRSSERSRPSGTRRSDPSFCLQYRPARGIFTNYRNTGDFIRPVRNKMVID